MGNRPSKPSWCTVCNSEQCNPWMHIPTTQLQRANTESKKGSHLSMAEFLQLSAQVKLNLPIIEQVTHSTCDPSPLPLVIWEPVPPLTPSSSSEVEGESDVEHEEVLDFNSERTTATQTVLMDIRRAVEHGYDWMQLIQLPHTIIPKETVQSMTFPESERWLRDSYPFLCAVAYEVATDHHELILRHVILDEVRTFPDYILEDILQSLGDEHPT